MYDNGQAALQDCALAIVWYRKAAGLDDVRAQFNLGWIYAHGLGAS
jgi:uncharacterized protein